MDNLEVKLRVLPYSKQHKILEKNIVKEVHDLHSKMKSLWFWIQGSSSWHNHLKLVAKLTCQEKQNKKNNKHNFTLF